MKTQLNRQFLGLIAALVLSSVTARAVETIGLESSYLGDGWFQYRLRVYDDPFFTYFDATIFSCYPTNSSSFSDEETHPLGWYRNVTGTNAYVSWSADYALPVTNSRPYERIFTVRSAHTNYTWAARSTLVALQLAWRDYYDHTVVSSAVGFVAFGALVPCPPEQADGSPSNRSHVLNLTPNVKIDRLLATNGRLYGLDFSYETNSTMRLEGSTNMQTWYTVTNILGWPPATSWTSSVPLEPFGNFFRLALVAERHLTNLVQGLAGTSTKASPPVEDSLPLKCTLLDDNTVVATLATTAGKSYEIQLILWSGQVLAKQTLVATGDNLTASFRIPEGNAFTLKARGLTP